MRQILLGIELALKDWAHELRLSICGVLALASIIAPLLILHGIHVGIIGELKNRLMQDPTVLVVIPAGSTASGYDKRFIDEVSALTDVQFCMARTRDIAAELQLKSSSGKRLVVTLEPTGRGDPVLKRAGLEPPADPAATAAAAKKGKGHFEIVLSHTAAAKLGVRAGDLLQTRLLRRNTKGALEHVEFSLTVSGVLPLTSTGMDAAFASLPLLLAVQDYRDDIASPVLKTDGTHPAAQQRRYESFRAYAVSLEAVERLDAWFTSRGIPVRTKAKAIADLRKMDEAFGAVVGAISLAAGLGFAAFMFSSVYAGVERKEKTLGMLRLTGFPRTALLTMPMTQSLATGLLGTLLSFAAYAGIAWTIDAGFASATNGAEICRIPPLHFLFILIGVEALTAAAALWPAILASRVEPAAAIRRA